jgi:hypothetical protein
LELKEMGFSGYYQILCYNGHYREEDVYTSMHDGKSVCNICKAPDDWSNLVDDTNGDRVGRVELEEDSHLDISSFSKEEVANGVCEKVLSAKVYKTP